MDTFLKITFIDGKSKFNTYLQNPAGNFLSLCSQVSYCIFQQRNLPTDEVRVYWIDEDGDQIDILDQQDYEVFRLKCLTKRHVCVERVKKIEDKSNGISNNNSSSSSNSNNNNDNNSDGSSNEPGSVHPKVQCDECNTVPIVGFRYKCLECENYDLCAKCEAKCSHPNHLMIRIPTPVLGYGRTISDFRKRAKRCGSAGPEDLLSGNCPVVGVTATGGRRHHHRKHARSSRGAGIFANLCEMMQHLAEGGAEGVYTAAARPRCTATPPPTPPEERDISSDVLPPKTPPPTPTNVNVPESPIAAQRAFENKSKEATTNTSPQMHSPPRGGGQSAPQLGSPLLENVQHFVDPQYMKAGIEILSNFSEMFSKMLEPVDGSSGDSTDHSTAGGGGGASGRCPFSAAGLFNVDPMNYSQSKSQSKSTSTSTSTGNGNSSFDSIANAAHKAAHDAAVKAAGAAAAAAVEASVHAAAATAAAANAQTSQSNTNGKVQENSDDLISIHESRHVSQNGEDGDWQMIDKTTPNASVQDLSGSVSSVSITSIDGAGATAAGTASSSGAVDYAKLSHDLKQHLNNEKKNEQENVKKATSIANESVIVTPTAPVTPPPPPPPTVVSPKSTPVAVNPPSPQLSSSSSSSSSSASASASAAPIYEEKRAIPVYHKDQRINSAVLSMMSMGFSNEGGWLTQLLETCNGSISDALDEMSAAQRNRN